MNSTETTDVMQSPAYKRSRVMYTLEAGFEYLVAILFEGAYLARLTTELGFSDSLTGVLSSIISLGCVFQLTSIFYRRKRMKSFVVTMSIINQLLFMSLYLLPFADFIPPQVKRIVFTSVLILAYLVYYFAHPKKIFWLMSVVDPKKRGKFTANKEIISLTMGLAFSYGMGAVIDSFNDKGNITGAFIVCGITVFALSVVHTLTLLGTVSTEMPTTEKASLKSVFSLFRNPAVLKITGLFLLWRVAIMSAGPFYATFQISDLGFSQRLIVILAAAGSLSRVLFSPFWGRYADKHSFAKMVMYCFGFLGLAYLAVVFATPETGVACFILYYAFNGVAMAGINSALTNLIFEIVAPEKQADAIAFTQAVSGVAGFLLTLAFSPVVAAVQANGNTVLGIPMYAQQLLSIVAVVGSVAAVLYIRFVILKGRKTK